MHDSETKRNCLTILSLAISAPGRTLYVQAVILRNLILTLKFHIVLAWPCVGITAHIWCQMKEDELNFVTIKTIFHKIVNFSGKITALSGFLFIGTHCIGDLDRVFSCAAPKILNKLRCFFLFIFFTYLYK